MQAAASDETSVLIMGHRVAFPLRKQHALVESPTGSGKTLALLSSCLTFQRDYMEEAMAEYYQRRAQQQQQQRQQLQQQQQQQQSQSQNSQASGWDDDAFGLLQRSLKRLKREDGAAALDVNFTDITSTQESALGAPTLGVNLANITSTQGSASLTPPDTQELYQESQQTQGVKQETEDEAALGPNELQSDEPPVPPKIFFCSRTHS
ncbi:hypothetical protein PI126_g15494 [Phytophthora idaei]|nr:hypothetical protein PI126_g15494 [Phytophthora idaei]